MPQGPATIVQLAILIFFILPGVTFQLIRELARGPLPAHKDMGERILRAVVASIVLDTLYLLVAGPWIIKLIHTKNGGWFSEAAAHPRTSALTALVLFAGIPALAAALWSYGERRRARQATYRSVPTSWDHAFRSRAKPCFVRVRTKGGDWVGGWYGSSSHAASYPSSADLFLESSWKMSVGGEFIAKVPSSAGLYIRSEDILMLEFVEAPPVTEESST